ncbi:DUF6984 family protein [Microbulbifer sp. ZKSA002]|uniref:DUF6984 family protein n=1 Tax=Microbulbifer sp. ZKSA002 TaxID=3243388 RepID=UPI00403A616A
MNPLLTNNEQNLIFKVSCQLNQKEGEQLRADLENAYVEYRAPDGAIVKFGIAGYERPRYRGQHLYGVEGKMADKDGEELCVLLYADENNRLLELEIIRWDESDLIDPKWESLSLY